MSVVIIILVYSAIALFVARQWIAEDRQDDYERAVKLGYIREGEEYNQDLATTVALGLVFGFLWPLVLVVVLIALPVRFVVLGKKPKFKREQELAKREKELKLQEYFISEKEKRIAEWKPPVQP